MFTLLIVAVCVAALLYFSKKKPPSASGPTPDFDPSMFATVRQFRQVEQEPERRIQLLSRKLQEVADERLMNDTLEDLGVTRPKPSRPAAAPA